MLSPFKRVDSFRRARVTETNVTINFQKVHAYIVSMNIASYTDMVQRAVMLVLLDVSMSTELSISRSRSVCVLGTSICSP